MAGGFFPGGERENKVLMRRRKSLRKDSSANQRRNHTFPISAATKTTALLRESPGRLSGPI